MLLLVLLWLGIVPCYFGLEVKLDTSKIHTPPPPKSNRMIEYGVDVSFPMHHDRVSEWLQLNNTVSVKQPLGNRQEFYNHFLEGCKKSFKDRGALRCTTNERARIAMSLRQPQSMTNYTEMGYKKIRAPPKIWKLIQDFWNNNHETKKEEKWGIGNTFTNNWESPSYMISVADSKLQGGGPNLKEQIWNASREIISNWTGQELTPSSLYGVRVYTEGAILATHVDRLPLVSSAIINVAQDVDEPWPLEVYGHDGKATNVTMEPGDMVLYESHSVLHGRPFPLRGRYLANIFIHFEPTGYSLKHKAKQLEKEKEMTSRTNADKQGDDDALPPYIIPGTPEEKNWRKLQANKQKKSQQQQQEKTTTATKDDASSTTTATTTTTTTKAHAAAQRGDLKALQDAIRQDGESIVHVRDFNGWLPLHEAAARGKNKHVVQYLHQAGADINARTINPKKNGRLGGTVLWWTKRTLGVQHEMVSFLQSLGAIDVGPEL